MYISHLLSLTNAHRLLHQKFAQSAAGNESPKEDVKLHRICPTYRKQMDLYALTITLVEEHRHDKIYVVVILRVHKRSRMPRSQEIPWGGDPVHILKSSTMKNGRGNCLPAEIFGKFSRIITRS